MKKKIFLAGVLGLIGLTAFACGKTTYSRACDNMSERTDVYYYAQCDGYDISIASGQREEPYLLNGQSEKKVDFALLCINLSTSSSARIIKATVSIDGQETACELEITGLNSGYMADLQQRLTGDEKISVTYAGKESELKNISKDFAINSDKAIEIGANALAGEIDKLRNGNKLNAECYLTVVDKNSNELDGTFWCFNVVNVNGESFSAIISTQDGKVLAKTNDKNNK